MTSYEKNDCLDRIYSLIRKWEEGDISNTVALLSIAKIIASTQEEKE